MKITVTLKGEGLTSLPTEAILEHFLTKAEQSMDEVIGPHMASVGQAHAPVSAERNFAPRAFHPLRVRPRGTFGPEGTQSSSAKANLLFDIRNMGYKERAKAVKEALSRGRGGKDIGQFFEGTGRNKGQQPEAIKVSHGTVKGAFRHKPGTLRESISYVGSHRDGDTVVGVVRAHAPYSWWVHEGFFHHGGWSSKSKQGGKVTRIKGQPYLRNSIPNIEDDLKNAVKG